MSKQQLQTNNEKYSQLIELLRGKAVGANIENLKHTYWRLNDVLNYSGDNVTFDVNFYFYDYYDTRRDCSQIELSVGTNGLTMKYHEYVLGSLKPLIVYNNGSWSGTATDIEKYKTIYFVYDTEDVGLIFWLIVNATLCGGVAGESSGEGVQTATPSGFLTSTAEGTVYYSLPSIDDSTLLKATWSTLSYFSFTKTYRVSMMDPMPIGTLFVIITTGTVTLPPISSGTFNLITSGTGYYIYSINSL